MSQEYLQYYQTLLGFSHIIRKIKIKIQHLHITLCYIHNFQQPSVNSIYIIHISECEENIGTFLIKLYFYDLFFKEPAPQVSTTANISAIPGMDKILQCLVYSTVPDYNITWYRTDAHVKLMFDPDVTIYKNGTLHIR